MPIEPGAYERFYAGVRDALRDGAPMPVDPRDSVAGLRVIEAARRSARSAAVIDIDRGGGRHMKTSLGIWAMGPMVTRFNPAGYKPELAGLSTAEYVRTAVAGLEGLIDDYEFHYPQELSDDNLDEVRDALDGHGIYAIASGMHLDNRFARGGLSSPDDAIRAEAVRADRRVRRVRRPARRADDHLARDRGLQLPLPDAVRAEPGRGSSTASARPRRRSPSTTRSSCSSTRTPSRR